ncbi:putative membrane protein [Nostocoides japonicum T1-X7]|uniref:Putative membrane protein n=1 Tax=Nostocoides japonicum T1-X7 TaxID=1194083 RepID=A0A077LZ35_9MICO|nr:thioredoxin domain-containing protein [Tetrasphaera japonica]CCH77255.1 putative membrane protein [Tetrasphaera japonica T1-X7]
MAKSKTKARAQQPRPQGKGGASSQQSRQAKIDAARKSSGGTGVNKIVVGSIVAVVAIVAIVGGVIFNSIHQKNQVSQGGKALPAGVSAMGKGWQANQDVKLVAGAPTVAIYEDFRCPICKQLESAFGESIQQLATEGKVKLVYFFKTVIDSNYGGDNSQQAANNALCVAEAGSQYFWKYHNLLYTNQPDEGSTFTNAQFTQFAKQAGLSGTALDTWQKCADAGKYMNYVKSTDDASYKAGITGTPAVFVNHKPVNWQAFSTSAGQPDAAAFSKALETGTLSQSQISTDLKNAKDLS